MPRRESRPLPTISRKVPPADPPLLIWRAPLRGVFQDQREGDPFNVTTFSRQLEAGVVWRSTDEDDREMMSDYFDFYAEGHAAAEADAMIYSASVLSSEEPGLGSNFGPGLGLDTFINALSLHTAAPLSIQLLRFEIETSDEVRIFPNSGTRLFRTVHLPSWGAAPFQQPIGTTTIDAVADSYPRVKLVLEQSEDHGLRRSLGAYRAAISDHTFIHAIPVLLCASLEALAASYKEASVLSRIARYAPEESKTLESLYKLRHWFAHGATIPEMKDPAVRIETLDKGIALVKEILVRAYADTDLFEAAAQGAPAVKGYLDSSSGVRGGRT